MNSSIETSDGPNQFFEPHHTMIGSSCRVHSSGVQKVPLIDTTVICLNGVGCTCSTPSSKYEDDIPGNSRPEKRMFDNIKFRGNRLSLNILKDKVDFVQVLDQRWKFMNPLVFKNIIVDKLNGRIAKTNL